VPKQSRKRSGSASSPRRRAASKPPASAKPAEDGEPKILVVDDEADQRTVIYHSLRTAGYSVTEAADGEEALKKLKRTKFDLVLLDIMMPRMSGYDVLDQLRAMPKHENTPVIVITAKHEPHGVMREASSGATDHLAKPFLPSELEKVVKRVLADPEREVELGRKTMGRSADLYGSISDLHRQARDDPEPDPKPSRRRRAP
jgi:CheY-like chemotaxis protein